jgi:hypothetical protein
MSRCSLESKHRLNKLHWILKNGMIIGFSSPDTRSTTQEHDLAGWSSWLGEVNLLPTGHSPKLGDG